ncbi:hypothetical protein [Bacillus weihaiensis]|nr:hypothetical protein [Bacillus weihaiensis]
MNKFFLYGPEQPVSLKGRKLLKNNPLKDIDFGLAILHTVSAFFA